MEQVIRFKLNRRPVSLPIDGDRSLLWVLRSDLTLTGTKFGCGRSECGVCTVVVNNEAIRSCVYPAKSIAGKEVLTIEGLEQNGKLHPLQRAFIKHGAVQCGFCTPGMIMKAYSFLQKNPKPSRIQIIEGMDQLLCRCGAYSRIIDAIETAAAEIKGRRQG